MEAACATCHVSKDTCLCEIRPGVSGLSGYLDSCSRSGAHRKGGGFIVLATAAAVHTGSTPVGGFLPKLPHVLLIPWPLVLLPLLPLPLLRHA